jgi:hypothetical protein
VAAIVSEDAPAIGSLVDLPAPIVSAIERCLARDPAARFGSVRDLMRALAPFAPAGCLGALSAQEALRDEPARVLAPSPSAARGDAKTVLSWGSAPPERGSAMTKRVGVASIIVALGLVGVIAGQLYGRGQGPDGKSVASSAPSGSVGSSALAAPTAPVPSVSAGVTPSPVASVPAQPSATSVHAPATVAAPSVPAKPSAPVKPKVEPTAPAPPPVTAPSAAPKPPPVTPPTPTVDPNHL